jgi:leader peptidase (prepilin peptidase)/N-methyltransferase
MIWLFTQTGLTTLVCLFFLIGAVAGGLANLWSIALLAPKTATPTRKMPDVGSSAWYTLLPLVGWILAGGKGRFRGQPIGLRGLAIELATGCLFAGYVVAAVRFNCQQISEVRPDDFWRFARIPYHLVLLTLLVAATATDLRRFLIPDQITFGGTAIGVFGAMLSGQLQMVHLWVDWNQEIPGIAGPFIPAWLDSNRHLHGLAWSVTGAIVGLGLAGFLRAASSLILRREAFGLGDLTLMAMIGSFLGWQPTVFVFAMAPLIAMIVVLPLRVLVKQSYLPYGPFLAAGTVIVLFTWRSLWLSTRLIWGDPQTIAIIAAAVAVALTILLAGLRLYRTRFGGLETDKDFPENWDSSD